MAAAPIVNPSFETGNFDGWVIESTGTVNYAVSNSENTPYGTWALRFTTGTPGVFYLLQDEFTPVYPGKSITASCNYSQGPAAANLNTGRVVLKWYDENDVQISESPGTLIFSTGANGWVQGWGFVQSQVTATAPDGAAKVKIGLWCNKDRNDWCNVDNFVWNYVLPDVTLTYPINNSTYEGGAEVPFRVEIALEGATVESVSYIATNTSTTDETTIGPVTEAPWGTNYANLPEGPYSVIARVTFVGGLVVDSLPKTFTVGPVPAPDTREFKASNSYTNLVAKNFVGLASAIPPTAQVVGMQTVVDYYIQALIRSKDLDLEDVTVSRYDAAFAMVPTVTFETVLLEDNGTTFTSVGGSATAQQDVLRSDFSVTEDGTSEGKRWTVLEGDPQTITVGQTNDLFGMDFMTASEFVTKALGLRFYPNLGPKPDYADSGDACFRVNLDKLRVQIYFDAGSVEYYFVSPDGTQVIKGRLAAAYVDSGSFATGDARGVMQLASDLEIVAGTSRTIQDDWTIHSAFPSNSSNQIGVVYVNMSYNGLPTFGEVEESRSRYQFISANFYGDLTYDSIYGVNGVDRAFSYNGDFFYKIHTQADAAKDKPRHLEFYHTHLALGYGEGRVDVSVVGEPYNFNGGDGASSWAIGDSVTGLLNLSGTMLGVFCRKSIHGLAGTTVDNFATQVLSPKIGAVEYTISDMGFPVYANAYGIYTLAQTAEYGDYLGTPMSQDVSPWLRPRLIRKSTSPREVVVAWPVRAKNQYRLNFKDGYVLTMTLNNGQQGAPTFSQQKYFIADPDADYGLYEAPSIVPSAVSSELDDGSEERIHIANKVDFDVQTLEGPQIEGTIPDGSVHVIYGPESYTATGGIGTLSFDITDGTFPPGLVLADDGEVTGTPTQIGNYSFTVRVTDDNGLYDEIVDTVEMGLPVFAARSTVVYVSPSGATWDDADQFNPEGVSNISVIKYANDRLYMFDVGSSTGGVVTTDAGQTTTTLTGLSGVSQINDIAWNGREYLAVTQAGNLWYSLDGVDFSLRSGTPVGNYLQIVTKDNIAVIASNNHSVKVSLDYGVTWQNVDVPTPSIFGIRIVMYLKDRFIAIDGYGNAAYSVNGINWFDMTGYNTGGVSILAAAWDPVNERLALINDGGDVYYSDDQGETTVDTGVNLGSNSFWNALLMTWNHGRFIYGSGDGNIYTSTDAVNWDLALDSAFAGAFSGITASL